MKVVCIKSDSFYELKVGELYDVVEIISKSTFHKSLPTYDQVKDPNGAYFRLNFNNRFKWVSSNLFKTLEDIREEKINEILS